MTQQDNDSAGDAINRRSKNITEGTARAPNRSMYYAMGYEAGDFKKPMVGAASGSRCSGKPCPKANPGC